MDKIVDIHTHILPGVDDGSKTMEESLKIIEYLSKSGVTDIVLTSHYINNTKYNGRGSHSELSDIDLLNKKSFAQNKHNAALHSGGVLEDHLYYEGTDHEEHVKDELPMDNFYSPERSDKE